MSGFDPAAVAARMTAGEKLLGVDFPRNLAETAPLTLPLSVSIVPSLTTRKVQSTLFSMTSRASPNIPERRLRGCLVAHRGRGVIFLDDDETAALRFAAAHEIAHFVGHYLDRREVALARLGSNVLPVLDGEREASPAERMGGILAGCPLGIFTDVMARQGGQPTTTAAERMEYEADEAAFIALAPIGVVIAKVVAERGEVSRMAVVQCLIQDFGLAPLDAERHAPKILNAVARSRPTFVEGLRLAASKSGSKRQK